MFTSIYNYFSGQFPTSTNPVSEVECDNGQAIPHGTAFQSTSGTERLPSITQVSGVSQSRLTDSDKLSPTMRAEEMTEYRKNMSVVLMKAVKSIDDKTEWQLEEIRRAH